MTLGHMGEPRPRKRGLTLRVERDANWPSRMLIASWVRADGCRSMAHFDLGRSDDPGEYPRLLMGSRWVRDIARSEGFDELTAMIEYARELGHSNNVPYFSRTATEVAVVDREHERRQRRADYLDDFVKASPLRQAIAQNFDHAYLDALTKGMGTVEIEAPAPPKPRLHPEIEKALCELFAPDPVPDEVKADFLGIVPEETSLIETGVKGGKR